MKKAIFKDPFMFLLGLFICFGIIKAFLDTDEINNNAMYTIGITTEKINSFKNSRTVKYYYYVDGVKYTGNTSYGLVDIICPNGRYFVKFSAKDHSKRTFLYDQPVPEHIKEAPPLGWDAIPY